MRSFCKDSNATVLRLHWCGREDSNFHGLSATATSTLRVYQFRHDRTPMPLAGEPRQLVSARPSSLFRRVQATLRTKTVPAE